MDLVGWYFDWEADNLYLQSTKVWYGRFTSLDKKRTMCVHPFKESAQETYDKIYEWIHSFPDGAYVVGHNILGYDFWLQWKLLDIVPRIGKKGKDWLEGKHVQVIDTYTLSMFLQPDNMQHSLEYLSDGSEDEKMKFRAKLIELGVIDSKSPKGAEFAQWHPLMATYCDDDVSAGLGVFSRLWSKAVAMYGDGWVHTSYRQFQKDYWLYSAQEYTGVKFNKEKAISLSAHIELEMAKLKAEVDPQLPPRPLKTAEKAFYKQPSKPYTKSGEMSATMVKWLAKHDAKVVDGEIHAYDSVVPIKANEVLPVKLAMEIDDNLELKEYFLQNKWEPTFWNFQKDPITKKPIRDKSTGQMIKTSPKIQEAGVICPNLLELEGEIPGKVVKFLSYRNRLGVVTGWLNNWRLDFDGRIGASITGYTPTFRVRHSVIVNCPKADPKVLLGAEMRDLWTVDKGYWYNGCDAAALENRTIASYTFKYDNGKFANLVLEGDSHSFNAFAFFPHLHSKFDINDPTLKDQDAFKPYRNKSKTGAYLLAYGGGEAKLSSSLNLSKAEGKRGFENYWSMNVGLGKFKIAAEKYYDGVGKKKHMPAIDGRILSIRGKNVIVNCLGQSCGAIAMSYAACLMDTWLGELHLDSLGRPYYIYHGKVVKRISCVHDEYSFQVEDGAEESVNTMMEKAIVDAGVLLKLSVPLAAEGKRSFEGSWKDVH